MTRILVRGASPLGLPYTLFRALARVPHLKDWSRPATLVLVRLAVAAGLAASTAGCTKTPPPYPDQIAAWHADKDRFMRESSESPVPAASRATFPPLVYFPTDPAYRVPAMLHEDRTGAPMEMLTSTGQHRQMRRVGTLAFTLNGQQLSLGAFVEANDADLRRLFVPFGDLTNGVETYNGGRYLELDRTATGVYDLDFNRAFHPFCLYNSSYDCPYPPPESRLKVPIRAGEKLSSPRH
jgi:hypothetical protein